MHLMSHKFLCIFHRLVFTVFVGLKGEVCFVLVWGFFVLMHEQGRGRIH